MSGHSLGIFLQEFIPKVREKAKQVNWASWLLDTTGSQDAAALKAALDAECRLLFNDANTYQNLLSWQQDELDPLHARQLNVLIRAFKQNQVPKELIQKMAQKEAAL